MEEIVHYVYRHRRLDNNSVFYVGKGKISERGKKSKFFECKFRRAFEKNSRTGYWRDICDTVGRSVDIIWQGSSEEDAFELEMLLISLYGRKDLGNGLLVNMTDGGLGAIGIIFSKKQWKSVKESNKGEKNKWYKGDPTKHPMYGKVGDLNPFFGEKHSEESLEKMRGKRPCITGYKNKNSKKVFNKDNGKIYATAKIASVGEGINYSNLRAYLNGNVVNKTNLVYLDELYNYKKYNDITLNLEDLLNIDFRVYFKYFVDESKMEKEYTKYFK